ncbi:MAG: alpha/beta fold hydrolase [Polyangiales bacterium]
MKKLYVGWASVVALATVLGCGDEPSATLPTDAPETAAQVVTDTEATDPGTDTETDTAAPAPANACGTVDRTDMQGGKGPFTGSVIQNGGPRGTSWVFFPKELGRNGCKHPIFNWGPGAGTGPSNYRDHLTFLASHGFVIISQPSSGNGSTEKPALEWLIAQNTKSGSQFEGKLDTTKVVMGGHSMGSLTTFAMADFKPITHYILVCGGSFGAPTGAQNIHGPTLILGGDTDSGTPNYDDDYGVIKTPVIFLVKNQTDHISCARNNMEPWAAWMRWQLYGEEKWKPEFFAGGKFSKSPWRASRTKNF